jgi:hypothetical protein
MKAETVLRIGELFEKLGWPIEDIQLCQFPDLFSKFCRMCSRLNEPQRELILRITPNYKWLQTAAMEENLLSAWGKLNARIPKTIRTLAVAPLLNPNTEQPKSSGFIWYYSRSYAQCLSKMAKRKKIVFCQDAEDLIKNHINSRTALVLVDDYVGSCSTANSAINHLNVLDSRIPGMAIFVLCLAAQNAALSSLDHANCQIIPNVTLFRGISDDSTLPSIPESLETMKEIEEMLEINDKYKMGFLATEALVTLTRTPNNTFPVFWTNKKVNGTTWDSPFTR